jgi:hypothetical protein
MTSTLDWLNDIQERRENETPEPERDDCICLPEEDEPVPTETTKSLAWGKKVSPSFRKKLYQICDELGWGSEHPSWLMACMAFETGRTFSPSIKNPSSSASGLIQFMDATARGLGTTTAKLRAMTPVQQLDWVKKYFKPYASRVNSLEDMYMAILWPVAVGKPLDYALWRSGTRTYAANRGLDVNRDRRTTKREAAGKVREQLELGMTDQWRFDS